MITTIQLNENVKDALDRLKSNKETYEEIILKMINQIDKERRSNIVLMIEGAKETAEESLRITKEFEAVENLSEWEW